MILKVKYKEVTHVTDEKTNFSLERESLKKEMGVLSCSDLSEKHFNFLLNHECTIKANDALAGHIENQFFFDDWPEDFEKYLCNKVLNDNYLKNWAKESKLLNDNDLLSLSGLWINKQKKYEFNPIHKHTGIFSFIIPLQIPYDLNEEDKIFTIGISENTPKTSRLEFLKSDNNEIKGYCLNVDKSYVGKVLLFPATLSHMVYPFFTSDDIRITVSGNIVLKDEPKMFYKGQNENSTSRMA
tara:strand:- start:30 stop:752 length:723 start_codon:yes stop_codon:yes gene_type:complete